jgi:hypothetical protein
MEQIVVTHGFVKKLAKNIRSRYGRDVRHTEVLELVADALGFKAGPLMHALKRSKEAELEDPSATSSKGRLEALPPGMIERKIDDAFDLGWVRAESRAILARFLEDQKNSQKYRDAGLDPMNKMMVLGSKAAGVAGHIAENLGLPLFEVSCDAIQSYAADGLARIRAAFEHATGQRRVLLLDDIDTICRDRGSADSGDERRLASMLFVLLDDVPADVIVIAGTSRPGLVDRALWRRFHTRIDLRPAQLDPASVLLRFESDWLSNDQRRLVALVDRANSGETVLLIAENYEMHSEVSAARAYLRRRGRDWKEVQFCRLEDLATLYRNALREG